jgi:hypothetical protein
MENTSHATVPLIALQFLNHLELLEHFQVTFMKQKRNQLSNFRGWQLIHRDDTTLVYVSTYKSSVEMDPAMWETDYPSPGQDCVHCTYTSCMDDGCGVNMPVQICSYPLGPPITNLQGLCAQSLLGNACFLELFYNYFLNCVQKNDHLWTVNSCANI